MAKIPTHIITGFLGSGKTTFLKELLEKREHDNIALIINELGEISLDHELIETDFIKEKTLFLNAGCACCNKREDLKEKFRELLNRHEKRGEKLQRVIIETTGLANPAPIIFTFLSDAFLSNHFEICNILTCVDALDGLRHLENEEACSQILSSDCIILTKSDLNANTQKLRDRIKELYPSIEIFEKQEVDFNTLFKITHKEHYTPLTNKTHRDSISSISLSFEKALDWNIFSIWLSMLLHEHGTKILRVKGLINTNEGYLTNINGVGHLIYNPTHTKIPDTNQKSSLIFIAKNLELEKIESSLKTFLSLSKEKTEFELLKNQI